MLPSVPEHIQRTKKSFRPVWLLMMPATLIFWCVFVLTGIFGPEEWFSSGTLRYINQIDRVIWSIFAVPAVVGIVYGMSTGCIRVLRGALGIAFALALCRTLLIFAATFSHDIESINTLNAWFFVSMTHFSMAVLPFRPDRSDRP